jgi:hypothetical protein
MNPNTNGDSNIITATTTKPTTSSSSSLSTKTTSTNIFCTSSSNRFVTTNDNGNGIIFQNLITIDPDTPTNVLRVKSYSFYQEEREQALRDYKVTIEYKHLKSHAPGGVYLIPSFDDLRKFYGVIFVRRGPFTNGIFKFQLVLPKRYNDINQHPDITFTSTVYNPYVDPTNG